MRHMLKPLDFSVEETAELLSLAGRIEKNRAAYAKVMEGKKLATLFYEPSTRTRLSFEAAMLNLGGSVLGFQSADASSASKGESVADTVRVVSCYADIIAMRHPKEGAPMVASEFSRVPIINAGDGGHQHPTQTLTDLMTIQSLKGRLDHMTVGLCGDLKFGRTVHSLISSLIRYPGIRFVLISPPELRIPGYIREDVLEKKLNSLVNQDYTIVGGVDSIVEILNTVDRGTEKHIMETLEIEEPELADQIRRKMFVFEDILLLDNKSIQRVLRDVDNDDLSISLKNVSEEVQTAIFTNLSKRLASMIKEEMEFMGPVRVKDVEEAQQKIVNIIRKLEDSGEIIISRGGGDEIIV